MRLNIKQEMKSKSSCSVPVISRIMTLKLYILIPGTCNYITINTKKYFVHMIKLRKLQWGNYLILGFPGGSGRKDSACNVGHLGLIPGLGRSPEGKHSNLLRYSCLENPQGQRSLVGCTPWGCTELATTE